MRKMGKAGLALALVGIVVFGLGFIGARGDLSVVNGSIGPMGVHLPATGGTRSDSSQSGIGGGRNKPVTTPPPADRAPVSTDGSHHDEHEYDGHDGQHTADCRSFPHGDVRKIELDLDLADLVLYPSPDGNVYVSSDRLDDFRISLDKNGTLNVESRSRVTFFGISADSPTLTVTLPESLICSLEADVDCGKIQLEDLNLDKLKLDADMGDVYVNGVVCSSADLKSSCGSVQALSVTSSGKLEVKSALGDVTLENCAAAAELKAESDCGKVTVDGCAAEKAELEADMGDVGAYWLSVSDSIKLDCDCGAIEFEGLTAGRSIEIDNSMGAIKGILSGSIAAYSIESGTDLGSCNLPSKLEMGDIRLKVHASCGSIDVSFEDN